MIFKNKKFRNFSKTLALIILVPFVCLCICPASVQNAYAQTSLNLPAPGSMVLTTPAYMPVMMKGVQIHLDNPLLFDFILDTGKSGLKVDSTEFKAESQKLIKYFLASLTIKEDDLWVNLSPYEKDRMIPDELGKTELGRDMLAQDYILKQLTSSLIYPEKELGQKFWDTIKAKAQQQFGSADIPVDTFNKVWIVADKAKVLERNNAAYVVGAHLKVMLEEDYVALENQTATSQKNVQENKAHTVASQILREIVIPEIEKEVNEGENFAPLRQMFYSMILASWYKVAIKDALLNQVYSNKEKTAGVLADDPAVKEKIYQQYLQAYKKGVFDYIKEDYDAATQEVTPRKYFSGGLGLQVGENLVIVHESSRDDAPLKEGDLAMLSVGVNRKFESIFDSIVPLKNATDSARFGGKASGLASAISWGFNVPEGFALDGNIFKEYLTSTGLDKKITSILERYSNDELAANASSVSKEIKTLILGQELTPKIREAVLSVYHKVFPGDVFVPVSVRSSAIGEDSTKTAFAGQHDTDLNIVNEESFIVAIRNIYASLFNERAIIYRANRGIPFDGAAMPVLVQKMQEGEASAVVASVNPHTGDKFETIITAALGLCKGIVDGVVPVDIIAYDNNAGKINPHRSVMADKDKMVVLEKNGGVNTVSVSSEQRKAWSLSLDDQESAVKMALDLQERMNVPVEIEMTFFKGKKILLQVRPITTLDERKALHIKWKNDEDKSRTWNKVAELDGSTPLAISSAINYNSGIREIVTKEMQVPMYITVQDFGPFIYRHWGIEPRDDLEASRFQEALDEQKSLEQEVVAGKMSRQDAGLWPDKWDHVVRPEIESHIAWIRKVTDDVSHLSYQQLHNQYLEWINRKRRLYGLLQSAYISFFNMNFENYVTKEDLQIISQGIDCKTTRNTQLLTEISDVVAQSPELSAEIWRRLENSEASDTTVNLDQLEKYKNGLLFKNKLTLFLNENGRITDKIHMPTWLENNASVILWILELAKTPLKEHIAKREEQIRQRENKKKEILSRVPSEKVAWMKYELDVLDIMNRFMDEHHYLAEQQGLNGEDRYFFLKVEERLIKDSILQKPGDIFFLTEERLVDIFQRMASGDKVVDEDLLSIINERRNDFEKNKKIVAPNSIGKILENTGAKEKSDNLTFFDLFGGNGNVGFDGKELKGTPVSNGIRKGHIRIINFLEELKNIQPGDVLVANEITPLWTSVFSKLSGLVLNGGGGSMQHAAIIAREFGIPAVLNTGNATEVLKDGQIVEVDGTNGSVTIVSDEAMIGTGSENKEFKYGGIDFNAKNMGLDISKEGSEIEMEFDPAMIADFQKGNFAGLEGIILRIIPIQSPLPILGLDTIPVEESLAKGF